MGDDGMCLGQNQAFSDLPLLLKLRSTTRIYLHCINLLTVVQLIFLNCLFNISKVEKPLRVMTHTSINQIIPTYILSTLQQLQGNLKVHTVNSNKCSIMRLGPDSRLKLNKKKIGELLPSNTVYNGMHITCRAYEISRTLNCTGYLFTRLQYLGNPCTQYLSGPNTWRLNATIK